MLLFYIVLLIVVYYVSTIIEEFNETAGDAFFYSLFFLLWFDYVFLEIAYKTILIPLKNLAATL